MTEPRPEMIDFRCPSCGQLLRVPEDQAGGTRTCAVCGTETTVPGRSESIEASTAHSALRVPQPSGPDSGEERPLADRDEPAAETRRLSPNERRQRHDELLRRLTARTKLFIPQWIYSTLVAIVLLTGCLMLFRGLLVPFEIPKTSLETYQLSMTQLLSVYWVITAVHLLVAIVLLVGIVSLQRMQYWWIAVMGAIVGMLPLQCCFPLTFPAAAWLLWLLMRPEIRQAFRSDEIPVGRGEP